MRIPSILAVAAIVASGASFAADNAAIDLQQQQAAPARSRAEVIAETKEALAAGEIKNGPLANMYDAISPAPEQTAIARRAPARKDGDKIDVATAPANARK
jgi:hypothetical protein